MLSAVLCLGCGVIWTYVDMNSEREGLGPDAQPWYPMGLRRKGNFLKWWSRKAVSDFELWIRKPGDIVSFVVGV